MQVIHIDILYIKQNIFKYPTCIPDDHPPKSFYMIYLHEVKMGN
jgi:hypothetical protein